MDDSFLDHQFKIDTYQFPPFRRNRNEFGGRGGGGGGGGGGGRYDKDDSEEIKWF